MTENRTARQKSNYATEIELRGGGSGKKLVAIDFRGDADVAVDIRFNANNLATAANIDFSALGDLLWQGQHKLDFGAHFELRFGEKIKSLVADVAGLCAEFAAARFTGKDP